MLEKHLWQWLKKGIPPGAHVSRVENSVAKGTPDVEVCINGNTAWIELKIAAPMANDKWSMKHLTVFQAEWHRLRYNAGGDSDFLIQVGKNRYLVPGVFARDLHAMKACFSEDELSQWGSLYRVPAHIFIGISKLEKYSFKDYPVVPQNAYKMIDTEKG